MPPSFNLINNATNRKYLFQSVMYIINVIWWKPYIWISFIRIVFQNHSILAKVSNFTTSGEYGMMKKRKTICLNWNSEKNILKPKKSLRCCCDFSGPHLKNNFKMFLVTYSKISKRIKANIENKLFIYCQNFHYRPSVNHLK